MLALSLGALPWPSQSVTAVLLITAMIALVAALFDAALAGALLNRAAGAWALLPQALVGSLLGGAVLVYPFVSMTVLGVLITLWTVVRGVMLMTLLRRTLSDDPIMRAFTLAWAIVCVLAPTLMIVHWRDEILPVAYLLVAYALTWSVLELAIGLHIRARGRRMAPVQ